MTDQCTNCGASVPDWAQLCGCAKTTDDGNVALITGERDEEDIAHFEDNDGVPTVEILQMIANALNVPVQALLKPQEG